MTESSIPPVYALTRQVTLASPELADGEALPLRAIDLALKQKSSFDKKLQNLGKVPLAEAREILKEREAVSPEEELNPTVIDRLQQLLGDRARDL